jgi:hypothetical protein
MGSFPRVRAAARNCLEQNIVLRCSLSWYHLVLVLQSATYLRREGTSKSEGCLDEAPLPLPLPLQPRTRHPCSH